MMPWGTVPQAAPSSREPTLLLPRRKLTWILASLRPVSWARLSRAQMSGYWFLPKADSSCPSWAGLKVVRWRRRECGRPLCPCGESLGLPSPIPDSLLPGCRLRSERGGQGTVVSMEGCALPCRLLCLDAPGLILHALSSAAVPDSPLVQEKLAMLCMFSNPTRYTLKYSALLTLRKLQLHAALLVPSSTTQLHSYLPHM